MAYSSFVLRAALGFTLGGLFFTQIQSRHADLPGGIWAALALAGAALGMIAAFSLEGLSAHRGRLKLASATGFAVGGLVFAAVFKALSGNVALLRVQLPVSAAFAGLLGGMGFGLGWRGPKYAVLLGTVSAIFLPLSMWLNVEIARRAMLWLVSYGQPDAVWIRVVAYGYALIGFTVYGSLFGLALGLTEESEAGDEQAAAALVEAIPPAPEKASARAAATVAKAAPAPDRTTTTPQAAKTTSARPSPTATSTANAAPATATHKQAATATPAATTKAQAPRRQAGKQVDTAALVEEARRRAAEPPPQDELERMFAGTKPAKPASQPASGRGSSSAGASTQAKNQPKSQKASAKSAPAAKAAPAAQSPAASEPAKPAPAGPRRNLHPDFAASAAAAAPPTPGAPAAAPAAGAAPASGGGLQILRNYHPDFAAGKASPTKPAAKEPDEVVDMASDEELSFIPDEDDNEFGLDVTAGGNKPKGDQPKATEVDLGEEEGDDYDFLRGDD